MTKMSFHRLYPSGLVHCLPSFRPCFHPVFLPPPWHAAYTCCISLMSVCVVKSRAVSRRQCYTEILLPWKALASLCILTLAPVASLLTDLSLPSLVLMTESHMSRVPACFVQSNHIGHATRHKDLFKLCGCAFTSSQGTQLWWIQDFLDSILPLR